MINHLHHVHIFASDIDKSIAFYRECFGGQVVLDNLVAGSRNVFMRIGAGRMAAPDTLLQPETEIPRQRKRPSHRHPDRRY